MDADLRSLRYFVAVAEELNFTRAAARLHMTQQPLSAAIRRFETDLGVDLFRRTTRHVELTEAGQALLEPARTALRAADDALAAARGAGRRGVAGELRFGLSSGARYGLEPLFAALAAEHPALHLDIRHDSAGPLIDAVGDGRLDLAVTFGAQIPADIEHERLKDEPVLVAVPATHALADRQTIPLAELAGETFAIHGGDQNRDYDQAVIQACRRSGFEPRTQSSTFHDAWEGAVHSGGCVGLTARTAAQAAHRDLRLLSLEESLTFPVDLVWLNANGALRPALAAAVQTALAVRDEQGWRPAGAPRPEG